MVLESDWGLQESGCDPQPTKPLAPLILYHISPTEPQEANIYFQSFST